MANIGTPGLPWQHAGTALALLSVFAGCASGTGERTPNGSSPVASGTPTTGAPAMSSTPPIPSGPAMLGGEVIQGGSGTNVTAQYSDNNVSRNGVFYTIMTNGWGPGFESHSISWSGTSFTIESFQGVPGMNYEPAGYPTVFCGLYSEKRSKSCGLPIALDSLQTLRTGWRWNPNGNTGEYNAVYDIWLGTGVDATQFSGFMMVWLRDPPGQQPAGSPEVSNVTVAGNQWDIWTGTVNGAPIINWVRAEGSDLTELEFDVLDFVRDATSRGLTVPGSYIQGVAVGFEIWNGPITNLASEDFYVEVTPKIAP